MGILLLLTNHILLFTQNPRQLAKYSVVWHGILLTLDIKYTILSRITGNIFLLLMLVIIPVVSSFVPDDVKIFRDSNSTIYIKMPADWNVQLHEDETSVQMFVSKEQEIFSAGVIITKIYNVPAVYKVNVKDDVDLINFWKDRMFKSSESYTKSENISTTKYDCGRYQGFLRESIHQYTESQQPVHVYTLVLANKGNIITVVAVAPDNEWNKYKPVFDAGLQSLELK